VEDRYPGSAVSIPFPIDPENFFAAKPSRDGYVDLEGSGGVGEA